MERNAFSVLVVVTNVVALWAITAEMVNFFEYRESSSTQEDNQLSLFTIVWYAAVELDRTWVWWVSGIITGMMIIAVFAVFEKRRDDVLRMVDQMREWRP